MLPFFTNVGAYIKASVNYFNNALAATATGNGTAVQIIGPTYNYKSAQICLYAGAAGGAPSAVSVTVQLQTSADGSTNWTNYNDLLGHGALTLSAASTQATQNVIIEGAQSYIRLAVTNALTGGTSPTLAVAAVLVIGGTTEYPAV